MKVRGVQTLPLDPEAAWDLLLNTDALAKAIPGCEALIPIEIDEYEMKMKVALGGIQGLFAGKVRITEKVPPTSYRLHVEGQGKLGFVRGSGLLSLTTETSGTHITYDGEVQVGGPIASVGERLLDVTTKMMIGRFFSNLAGQAGTKI
jgi:hypothetical protein